MLKKEVIDFRRAAEPLLDPLRTLASQRTPLVHPDIGPFFTDVRDNLARTVDRIADQRDLLSSVLDANLTQVAIRQNQDMRKISSWVAIAAVPTMIAGIYGMNFTNLPDLSGRSATRWCSPCWRRSACSSTAPSAATTGSDPRRRVVGATLVGRQE